MNRNEIRDVVVRNMTDAGFKVQDIRVQPDLFSGWRIAIVSSDFAALSQERRRQLALRGLEEVTLQWLDLLTPEEAKWAGELPIDSDLEELPMWPEAMARPEPTKSIIFPSDLDEDLDRPIIATFYSLRGGVGRSTALAYAGHILASRGHSVLCVDMDLEAPGLPALFDRENEIGSDQGVLSLLLALEEGVPVGDYRKHLMRLSETTELYGLPAGVPDADYARRLRLLDPETWYRTTNNPLHSLFDALSGPPLAFDVILVDARTGITPISAPLLFDISDLAVVTFFPHPQAYSGTRALVQALLKARARRSREGRPITPEPRFVISPVPASKAPEVMQRYHDRATDWISDWLSPLKDRRDPRLAPVWPEDITHFVPYRESIATSDKVLNDRETLMTYEPIADWLERFIPSENEMPGIKITQEEKLSVLEDLEFSAGTAEDQKSFLETFVRTELFARAMAPDKPLVLGRKGTGKTAIFRQMVEGRNSSAVAVLCPAPLRTDYPWVLGPDGFQAVEERLNNLPIGWREFWAAYCPLAVYMSLSALGNNPPLPDEHLSVPIKNLLDDRITDLRVVECICSMLDQPMVGLLARDWMERIDATAANEVFLMFDGLDTGFGNRIEERERRAHAIEGLLAHMTDHESRLKHFRFKILLRDDIWKKLRFENKSHLYGRSVRLAWQNLADYAKTALKQALQTKFGPLVRPIVVERELEWWSDEEVFRAWDVLVGERMKGEKTAFTRNWVWNRLADGNGDRTPRALLQLFKEAREREREENHRVPYDRSIIRPRALINSLESVSQQALDALQEEFKELEGFIQLLQGIGRSPVDASELKDHADALDLAREVGLVEVYEGTEDDARRYRIPDLYRLALGMTRKGQA